MPYVVGGDPGTSVIRYCIDVPDDLLFRAAFKGALLELAQEYNWEFVSGLSEITAPEATALALSMYLSIAECGGSGDMELIADVVLVSDVSYIEFADIPQDFAALEIHAELQSNGSIAYDGVVMTLNGDTGANYGYGSTRVEHSSATHVQSAARLQTAIIWPRAISTNTAGTLLMSSLKIDMQNYASTERKKLLRIIDAQIEDESQISDYNTLFGLGTWGNQSDGVDTVRLAPQSGTVFKAESRVRLYGLRGA